jgi:stage III sporulation protein AC
MGIDIVFKIAGIGILVAVVYQLLKQTNREEMATLAALAGLIITLTMVVNLISGLFDNMKRIFDLY